MEAKNISERIDSAIKNQPHHNWGVFVKVLNPGTIGGTPCVEVKQINVGFDWDAGKIILETDRPLTSLSEEDVKAIHKSAKEGQSWHAFQSYKKQADRIKELEAELKKIKLENLEKLEKLNVIPG